MQIVDITYEADGRTMVGRYAVDEYRVGPRPAVLLCHEGPGLDEHVKGRVVRLASLGYAAFALDYHGGRMPIEDAMTRIDELWSDAARCRRIGRAGLDVLLAQEHVDPTRVAATGYCFGGVMAMELARDGAALQAVVGFHPGLSTAAPAAPGVVSASVLMCCGADDPVVGPDQRSAFESEMHDAEVADWRIELYGGIGHSFTNPRVDTLGMPGLAYDEVANRRSWRSMVDLLDQRLGPID